jgi:hypothetical protein
MIGIRPPPIKSNKEFTNVRRRRQDGRLNKVFEKK